MSDESVETPLDADEEAARLERVKKFKGSQVFARWYQEVFLPNGGSVYSNCLDGLWDSLEGEFFDWLDQVAFMRQEDVTKENKRKFEYWYKHVYKGKPSTEEDPRYDDDIWNAYVSWGGYTYYLEDLSVDDRQGWDNIFENINSKRNKGDDMIGTDTKPCGSKACHEWIMSQGYDPEDYPEGLCVECSSSGLLYDWMAKRQNQCE